MKKTTGVETYQTSFDDLYKKKNLYNKTLIKKKAHFILYFGFK